MHNVAQPFLFTYAYASGTGGALPIIANVTINNVIATAGKTQGAIVGLANDMMGQPSSGNFGIKMLNTKITGGSNFSVTYGELQVGTHSTVSTSREANGLVVPISDTGPTISCPSSINIPSQI
jgi:polygalacturonase